MYELSAKETQYVNGGFGVPGAVVGGILSGAGYIGSAAASGQGSIGGFLTTVGAGALAGFFTGGVTSIGRTYLGARISLVGGAAASGPGSASASEKTRSETTDE